MTASVWTATSNLGSLADRALKAAARFWFITAVIGQWIFVAYVAIFYGGAAIEGNLAKWNKTLPHGYVPGDTMNNFAVAAHLLLAVIVTAGGPLQLIPSLRSKMPKLHRWNGRVYLLAVVATSVAGLYMVWTDGTVGGTIQHLGISLDAVLIIAFAILALRRAMTRDLAAHRRWALRLFMVVNGVWFFRVGLMFWIFVNRGPAGFDPKTFTGPFLDVWSFGDYLLPLLVLELYLRARDRGTAGFRLTTAAIVLIATIAMGIGIAVATMGMWLPRIA
jgi:uncharacterized membrane protein